MNIRKESSALGEYYIARKFYGSTGAVIEAKGDTKEEAKKNLKAACQKYKEKPLRPKKDSNGQDMTFFSPGYQSFRTGVSVQHMYNPDRRGNILEANV
jgi:hypothetical protein